MPTVLKSLTFNGHSVDIIRKSGHDTLWVEINGRTAAAIHCSAASIQPMPGWTIPTGMDSWILGHALGVHDRIDSPGRDHSTDVATDQNTMGR
ncbi:hypothetical protein [Haloglycomyces albus]|uniref:hypothetical protein n=1 Tax=Haloglycomyces albus TaxID=526067 RepID=UPI00055255EB|nr:hypothetical protein [Haloglycomyces albus]